MTSHIVDDTEALTRGGRARRSYGTGRAGDRIFRTAALVSGLMVLIIMGAIALFLIAKAIPALQANKANFLTSRDWDPDASPSKFGIYNLVVGTVMSSLLALLMATPVAIGIAMFTAFYAPRRFSGALGYVVDLLAAVPSVVYGLWGLAYFVPKMETFSGFLHDNLGWIPFFGGDNVGGRSVFTAAIVLAIMILPIISSLTREVFLQVPQANVEAALALGATRWEMMRLAVLPYGRSGMVSAAMLGLGRALGETIAVAMVLSIGVSSWVHILSPAGNTFAANIANSFGEAGTIGRGALIASGLVLFVITLVVNTLARTFIVRRKELA